MVRVSSKGFTLIEIAIVLVIIGLLLGGVLRGQELITSARVRNLIAQQDGVKAAFFGFQDRYRALPGDYASASANINCAGGPCANGNGNGQIESGAAPVNGSVVHEELVVWSHLSAAGFLSGSFNYDGDDTIPNDGNSPKNPYSSYLLLVYDGNYGASPPSTVKHNLKTGSQIPVEILAEMDRKIDDGQPYTGGLQFSTYAPAGSNAPDPASCVSGTAWNIAGGDTNCEAVSLF